MPQAGQSVHIRIESRQNGELWACDAEGWVYPKRDALYIRYKEPDESTGETMTTVKVEEQQISIIRHGAIESRQLFVQGKTQLGYYSIPQGRLELTATTHWIRDRLQQGIGTIGWSYDLTVGGEHAGTVELTLHIQGGQSL